LDEWFRDDEACRGYIRRLRWPSGFVCPIAVRRRKPWTMAGGWLRCRVCRAETSLTAGTIFEGTRKPLRTWFLAMWFVTSQKNGVSALGLQRELGFGSYETAWTWLHKLRRAMVRPGRELLSGDVEVDETYVGGPQEGKRGRGAANKTIIAVAAEKSGRGVGRIRFAASAMSPQTAFFRSFGSRCVRLHRPQRWVAGLCRTDGGRVPPPSLNDQWRRRSSSRSDAARPPRRLAAQAMADRHPPGRNPTPASRLLPRRFTFRFNRRRSKARGFSSIASPASRLHRSRAL